MISAQWLFLVDIILAFLLRLGAMSAHSCYKDEYDAEDKDEDADR